jgi:hypothetical protein
MKKASTTVFAILALAGIGAAHPGHDAQAYGIFWKHPGQAHKAEMQKEIWRYAFVSKWHWIGDR